MCKLILKNVAPLQIKILHQENPVEVVRGISPKIQKFPPGISSNIFPTKSVSDSCSKHSKISLKYCCWNAFENSSRNSIDFYSNAELIFFKISFRYSLIVSLEIPAENLSGLTLEVLPTVPTELGPFSSPEASRKLHPGIPPRVPLVTSPRILAKVTSWNFL